MEASGARLAFRTEAGFREAANKCRGSAKFGGERDGELALTLENRCERSGTCDELPEDSLVGATLSHIAPGYEYESQ